MADYNFGAQAQALSDIGGVRGEVQGRIYLPNGSGPHPLVIFMHGRHGTCYNLATLQSANVWPCPAGDGEIDSYAGYDGGGRGPGQPRIPGRLDRSERHQRQRQPAVARRRRGRPGSGIPGHLDLAAEGGPGPARELLRRPDPADRRPGPGPDRGPGRGVADREM